MEDNRKVKDTHQEGIERVKMRKGDLKKGQDACMRNGWKHERMHESKKGHMEHKKY